MFPTSERARRLRLRALPIAGVLIAAVFGTAPLVAQDGEPWDPPVLPGDLVSISFPEMPDFNGGYTVTQFHTITIPRIGELDVRGLTQTTVRDLIREEYGRIYRTSGIDILLVKRIRVLGSVTEPGLKNVDGTMTIADALALAAGRTPEASQDRLQLRRDGEVIEENPDVGRLISDLRIRTGDELFVPERPWLQRNLTPVLTSLFSAITVVVVAVAGSG